MKPRSLRHRLEKTAKLLVIVQKHAPEVHCQIDPDRGADGSLLLDFDGGGESLAKLQSLGRDLEARGYCFTQKRSPWLGQITYTGRCETKPTLIGTLPIQKDRLSIEGEFPEKPHLFRENA